jgi:hypothetical protein
MLSDLHAFGQAKLLPKLSIRMQQMFWMDLKNKESARQTLLLHTILMSGPNADGRELNIKYPFTIK